MKFNCEKCGGHIGYDLNDCGKCGTCPHCAAPNIVPQAPFSLAQKLILLAMCSLLISTGCYFYCNSQNVPDQIEINQSKTCNDYDHDYQSAMSKAEKAIVDQDKMSRQLTTEAYDQAANDKITAEYWSHEAQTANENETEALRLLHTYERIRQDKFEPIVMTSRWAFGIAIVLSILSWLVKKS